jgi:MFS family permease
MRFVTGFCLAGLYVVAESWLNARATNATRGRLLSIYMIVVMGGLLTGQLLLGIADPEGFGLFVLASVLVSVAVVPISLSVASPPDFTAPDRLPFRELWAAAPLGIVGGIGTGMANGALLGMGAFYATSVGMSPPRVALFMGAAVLGAVVLQWPIGALSDRVPRRRTIAFVTFAAGVVAMAMTQLSGTGDAVIGMMFLFGGLTFPLYSLNLSHINDVIPEGQTVVASSMFVFVTGVGAILGPVAAAGLMASSVGNIGFFWTLAGVHGVIGVFALYRIAVRPGLPAAEQKDYVPAHARASAVMMRLTKVRKRNGSSPGA